MTVPINVFNKSGQRYQLTTDTFVIVILNFHSRPKNRLVSRKLFDPLISKRESLSE